jgi:hypothetical protein
MLKQLLSPELMVNSQTILTKKTALLKSLYKGSVL